MSTMFSLLFFSLTSTALLHSTPSPSPNFDPPALYLTWQGDPTTTMTIQWISRLNEKDDRIKFQRIGQDQWQEASAIHFQLPEKFPYLLHRIEIIGLLPGNAYRFQIGSNGPEYKFRTLPATLAKPLSFVEGGDVFHDSVADIKATNIQAAKQSPSFALLGGDLAYTAKKDSAIAEDGERWLTWLTVWKQTMVTPDGFLIPMITAIGNHDTRGRYFQTPDNARFYYALFRTPGNQGYRTFDAGDYLAITILDSGHTHPIDGKQTAWLEEALKTRNSFLHQFALYHVPAYPSVREQNTKMSPAIREHWVPLFDKYNLHAAFEHHDHAYKRTVLLKGGKEDPSGVLYIGDGGWGIEEGRNPRTTKAWYLAKIAPARHFILVTLDEDKKVFEAIDSKGVLIDSYTLRIPEMAKTTTKEKTNELIEK
ncbi:MAG: metallophosphoesterase family protein [Parachlamydiaceae bacterium]|nr:metallophosphoesterase family protein [Parachlamydiaceae bacterium]